MEKRKRPELQIEQLLDSIGGKNLPLQSPTETGPAVFNLYTQLRKLNGKGDCDDHHSGFNIFDKTQLQKRDLRKGLQEEERLENERKKGNEMLMGMPAKHYRTANEDIQLMQKYGMQLVSEVSPSKAKQKVLEYKLNHYKEIANQPLDNTQPSMGANERFVRNKKMIVKTYNLLDKHCKELAKSNKKANKLVAKKFSMLSTGLEQMNSEMNEFDVILENDLRKDLLNELKNGQNQLLLGKEAKIEQKKKEDKENYEKEKKRREMQGEQEKKLNKERGGDGKSGKVEDGAHRKSKTLTSFRIK